jgi:hypothetical protein
VLPDGAHARQVGLLHRLHAGLQAVGVEGRAGAEEGGAGGDGKAPQHPQVGRAGGRVHARVAVVDADGGAAQQRTDLRVPHDPAGAAVPVVAVAGGDAGADVVVQLRHLQHLEHDAAMPVHDGLGQPGGAAGVHHPQRVVEGQPVGLPAGGGVTGGPALEAVRLASIVGEGGFVQRRVQVGQQHQVLHAGQPGQQLVQHGAAVEGTAAVELAVHRHQHPRRDLAEAVEHRHRPHVGRAQRPHRAQRRRGQEGDDGVRRVGQVAADAVAALHAHARSRVANTATWRCSSGQPMSTGAAMRSFWNTMAGWPAACAAAPWRSSWRVQLTCAPGNQQAPGITAASSSVRQGVGDSIWK